ncbi:MAG: type II secretion system GspH family protein [Armatimonadetes bacterium]|nr:type II secretion system GspH family protein [Armatimonadota bacterium]
MAELRRARQQSAHALTIDPVQRAFTLIELLVAIAIMMVLLATLGAVFAEGRGKGKQTVSLSNIRQSGLALLLYDSDRGDLPSGQAVASALDKAPTTDPFDYWERTPGEDLRPLVGSFGYPPLLDEYEDMEVWQRELSERDVQNPILLASAFHGSRKIKKFSGDISSDPPPLSCNDYTLPEKVLVFRAFGDAKFLKARTRVADSQGGNRCILMRWRTIFLVYDRL